jgi:uncharacterized surface protein with fasciclin (FAS1) repeats
MSLGRPLLLDAVDESAYDFSNNNNMDQFQQMMAAMASAQISAAPKNDEDSALSSLFSGQSGSSASAGLLNDLGTSDTSGFMTLMKNTDVSKQLASAAANGQSVTIFAPDNKAMAKMPNSAAKRMAQAENRSARNAFAKQHAAVDFENKMAEAQMGPFASQSVAFSTVNPKRHVSVDVDDEGRPVATMFNSEGEMVASVKITKTVIDQVNGHKLHVLDSALQQ